MTDFATLSFAIDSTQALQAVNALQQLQQQSGQTGYAAAQFGASIASSGNNVNSFTSSLNGANTSAKALDGTLGAFLLRMDAFRSAMGESTKSLNDYRTALEQTAAVAQGFGQNVQGFENYVAKAQQLKIAAGDVGPGLERITAALANQSEEGRRVRDVLEQYGVSLKNLGIQQADAALASFVSRLTQTRDSLVKLRDVQSVLGNVSAETVLGIQNPEYVPFEQRQITANANQRKAALDQQAYADLQVKKQQERDAAELEDLRSRFTNTNRTIGDRLFGAGSYFGDNNGFGSADEELKGLRAVSDLPPDVLARTNFRPSTSSQSHAFADDNRLARFLRNFSSGQALQNVDDLQRVAEAQRTGPEGPFRADLNEIGNFTANLFGYYKPQYTQDTRPKSQAEIMEEQRQQGQALARYGDPTMSNIAGIDQQQYLLSQPDAASAFNAVYGIEGPQRLGQRQDYLTQQRGYARDPQQQQIDLNQRQSFLYGLPQDQRAAAQAFLSYGDKNGIATSGVTSQDGATMDMLKGLFDPSQQASITKTQQTGSAAFSAGDTDAANKQLGFQQSLADTLKDGKSAAEDYTRVYNALQQAIGAGADQTAQTVAMLNAYNVAQAQRHTQSAAVVADMQAENAQLKARNDLAQQVQGLSPEARQAAMLEQGVNQDIEMQARNGALHNNPAAQAARRQEQLTKLGQQGVSDAISITTATGDNVSNAQQVLQIMQQQGVTQERATAMLQQQQQFQKAIAEAMASGNAAALADVQAQQQKNALLSDQLRLTQANIAAQQQATANDNDAAINAAAANAPPGQGPGQRGFILRNRSLALQYGSALGGQGGLAPGAPAPGDTDLSGTFPGNNPTGLAAVPGGGQPFATGVNNGRFTSYNSIEDGIGGSLYQMLLDQSRAQAAGKPFSIASELNTRSPASDGNNTDAMISAIAKRLGIDPTAPIDLTNPTFAASFLSADISQEYGGRTPPTSDQIAAGVSRGQAAFRSGGRNNVGAGIAAVAGNPALVQSDAASQAASDQLAIQQGQTTLGAVLAANNQRAARAGFPGQQALVQQVDPNNPTLSAALNLQRNTEVTSGQQLQNANQTADIKQQIQDEQDLAKAYTESQGAVAVLTANQRALQAQRQLNLSQAQELQRFELELGKTVSGQTSQAGQQSQQIGQRSSVQTAVTAASSQGPAAEAQATRDATLATSLRSVEVLKAADATHQYTDRLNALEAALKKNASAEAALTASEQQAAINRSGLANDNQIAQAKAQSDLGPFATDRERALAQAQVQADQQAAQQYPGVPDASSQIMTQKKAQLDQQQTSNQTDQLRGSFQQAGSAIENAFNNAITSGGRLRNVMTGLTQELGNIALKAAEQPLEKLFGGLLSSAGSSALSFLGLGSSPTTPAPAATPTAVGGAFVRGTRVMAAGDVVYRPTTFPMASGQGLMGEAGPEAVMPLERLPNGSLGVRSAGGGGGGPAINSTIHVHMGNVNMGGADNTTDRDKAMKAQMTGGALGKAIEAHVSDIIAKQFRDGGALRQMQPGSRF